jgi:hypothetical protein
MDQWPITLRLFKARFPRGKITTQKYTEIDVKSIENIGKI